MYRGWGGGCVLALAEKLKFGEKCREGGVRGLKVYEWYS